MSDVSSDAELAARNLFGQLAACDGTGSRPKLMVLQRFIEKERAAAATKLAECERERKKATEELRVARIMDAQETNRAERRERLARAGAACIYAALYPALRDRAREMGYALALHGSMVRDCDLIAVAWTEEAASPDLLAEALQQAVGGWVSKDSGKVYGWSNLCKTTKPRGRVAYTLRFGSDELLDIDLSVVASHFDRALTPQPAPGGAE